MIYPDQQNPFNDYLPNLSEMLSEPYGELGLDIRHGFQVATRECDFADWSAAEGIAQDKFRVFHHGVQELGDRGSESVINPKCFVIGVEAVAYAFMMSANEDLTAALARLNERLLEQNTDRAVQVLSDTEQFQKAEAVLRQEACFRELEVDTQQFIDDELAEELDESEQAEFSAGALVVAITLANYAFDERMSAELAA